MDPAQTDRLLRGLFAAGTPSAEQRAAVTAALTPDVDAPTAAEKLAECGLITRYQYGKVKNGRVGDLLFGPYVICDKIGEGGMGKVYRAVHSENRSQVALKVVRPHLMANAVVQKRYAREARAAASFDHPNIIKLLAEDTVDGRYYLAMEYIEGSDLSRLVREFGKPPEKGLSDYREAAEYVRQAALGLQHAHDRGFVHRDVKPSNLLAYGDRPLPGADGPTGLKILDMGLVRRLMGADDDMSRNDLTRDGTVVGTPDYMSPEQAKNSSAVDGKADQYSLGCTLYFLLHGRPPFDGGSPIDKLLRHHTEPAPDPRAGRPDIPQGLADVISRLMQKNPADRYPSAGAVAVALSAYCPGGIDADPKPAPVVSDFAFAPSGQPAAASTTATPAAGTQAGSAPRQLRLKVKEPGGRPNKVPTAIAGARTDVTPSEGSLPAARIRPATSGGSDTMRRRSSPQTPADRTGRPTDTPRSDRLRTSPRRPTRKKKPVWPLVAAGVGSVLLLGVVAILITRGSRTPSAPTPATPTGPARDPGQPPPRPVATGDAVADRAVAVVSLRPASFAPKLPEEGNGRLVRVLADLKRRGIAAGRTDRVTVSLVGGSPVQAAAVGEGSGPAVVIGNDSVRGALEARRSSGRPAAGLSSDLQSATKAAGEGGPAVSFAADGGFTLPGGDTLAAGRVRWAAGTATLDGDAVNVSLTLAGQDRPELLQFVSLELAGKVPAAYPALKPVCDRLAAADPVARRTDAGLELTFRFRIEWPELLALFEQLLPTS